MRRTRACAVAVVVLAAAMLGSDTVGSGPVIWPGGAADPGPQVAADEIRVPLRYTPTWLPVGIVERERVLSARDPGRDDSYKDATVSRTWRNATTPLDEGPYVALTVSSGMTGCPRGAEVDINGVRGNYYSWQGRQQSCVIWRLDPRMLTAIWEGGLGLHRDDLLRIARSVRPDSGMLVVPFRMGRLDDVRYGTGVSYVRLEGDSPTSWRAWTDMGPVAKNNPRGLLVEVGSTTSAPAGGMALTVGGRPARFSTVESGTVDKAILVVELGTRLMLTVTYWAATEALPPVTELIKVTERTNVGTPDVSWIGTRPG